MKRLRWDAPEPPRNVPKHPYRDSALVYGALALIVVVVAFLTGGGILRAAVYAALVFVAATLWSWRSWRNRLREERLGQGDR
jgi:hypothetical protein